MRITRERLDEKRRSRAGRMLVTGGTGFLGGHIVAELLKRGYPITVLVRSSGSSSGRERMSRILDWFGLEDPMRSRLEVIEGSIDRMNLGLSSPAYHALIESIDEIIHCASNTSFSERKRGAVERANIDGMGHVLDLAGKGRCFYFHYVSTAYAAGRKAGICGEELSENAAFTNVYEETKYRAERMASERCGQEGIRLSVYRPSIVYGHSKTGRSTRFNALYYPVKTLFLLKTLYDRDIRERDGAKAREMGVRLAEDGSLYLPIRVEVRENGGVNLIPVDYFTDAFLALMEECLDGGIFHIVNHRLIRIEELIDYTKRFLRISGLEPCEAAATDGRPKNALQILFDAYLDVYGPYMRDTRTFDDRNAQAILSQKGLVCPDFDFDVFSRCMQCAVECEWGRKVFAEK